MREGVRLAISSARARRSFLRLAARMNPFDFAVIGRGLMGTACARHLAEGGHSVALIGPDEPADPATHDGPFASHHDAGRITRILAHDADWARLSARSIARYRDIGARSGIDFYHPVGGMMAAPSEGPGAAFGDAFLAVADAEGIAHDRLDGAPLSERFPMFEFAPGTRAAWDPAGGWIDPRAMRRAEEALAVAAGASVFPRGRHRAPGRADHPCLWRNDQCRPDRRRHRRVCRDGCAFAVPPTVGGLRPAPWPSWSWKRRRRWHSRACRR